MWALLKLIGKTAYGPSVTVGIFVQCFHCAAILNDALIVRSGYFNNTERTLRYELINLGDLCRSPFQILSFFFFFLPPYMNSALIILAMYVTVCVPAGETISRFQWILYCGVLLTSFDSSVLDRTGQEPMIRALMRTYQPVNVRLLRQLTGRDRSRIVLCLGLHFVFPL